jgi:hypothetical protein
MFQKKLLEKIKTHILHSETFFQKSCRLGGNVEKYGRAGQATDDYIIRSTYFAYWITNATDTLSEYVILIAFHSKNGYMTVPQCYVLCTLPLMFLYKIVMHIIKISK